ncbi:MAG TPA: ABC transporter ATP-binding protein [Noviherbaspirillum sp.]|uniref:ABC transporter ATP-binding protein n=1 Tax=Noviherbaspirillum sp. TaxID=1926288 RepID=UPI002F94F117
MSICFDNVAKRYGQKVVLHEIDLQVAKGEFFGLVGVNGAGKTTLIKSLLDFVQIDGGRIAIDGCDHRKPQSRGALAFLPERFIPPYYLTGSDFLRYALSLHGVPYRRQDAEAMLKALDLDASVLARPVRLVSKGMTQKLGLAACLLAQRDLYILDEPMSGLDPRGRALLKAQLRALRGRGATVFFSSHALADVEEMCDRMAILHGGRIRFRGTPAECRATYGGTLEQAFLTCIGQGEAEVAGAA